MWKGEIDMNYNELYHVEYITETFMYGHGVCWRRWLCHFVEEFGSSCLWFSKVNITNILSLIGFVRIDFS